MLYSPCPCVRVEAAPLVVEASKPAKVTVRIHSLTLEGRKSFPVYVELLEPAKGVLRADVTAEVERVPAKILLTPEAFHFGSAKPGKTATVRLANLTKYPLAVQELASTLAGSAVEMKGTKTLAPGEAGELTLKLALQDKDPDCRRVASTLAAHIGSSATALAPELIALLSDQSALVKLNCINALDAMSPSPPDVPGLVWRYSYNYRSTPTARSEPSLPPFDNTAWPRPTRLDADTTRQMVAGLVSAIQDEDQEVAEAAMSTLRRFGHDSAPAVNNLIGILTTGSEDLRVNAVAVLACIGPEASGAISALTTCLADPCEDLRVNAICALARAVKDRAVLEKLLTSCAKDGTPRVREAASKAMAQRTEP